jgi:hypothetical protein
MRPSTTRRCSPRSGRCWSATLGSSRPSRPS